MTSASTFFLKAHNLEPPLSSKLTTELETLRCKEHMYIFMTVKGMGKEERNTTKTEKVELESNLVWMIRNS